MTTPSPVETALRAEIAAQLLSGILAHQPPSFTTNHDAVMFRSQVSTWAEKAVVAADILLAQLAK